MSSVQMAAQGEQGTEKSVPASPSKTAKIVPVCCKECGCSTWDWYTKTSIRLQTEDGQTAESSIVSRELRCASCNHKATMAEANAIQQNPAWRRAANKAVQTVKISPRKSAA